MTTLVEKVADAIGKAIRQSGYITNPEMDNHVARAAIATVLREMMEPRHQGHLLKPMWTAWWKTDKELHNWDGTTGLSGTPTQRKRERTFICFTVALRAFASEHGIELEKQP